MEYKFTAGQPVDRIAKRVVSGGIGYVPACKKHEQTWSIMPTPEDIPNGVQDITNMRRGRMVIAGYYEGRRSNGRKLRHYWITRCDCGTFVVRLGKKFAKNTDKENACPTCKHKQFLARDSIRRAFFNMTGSWPNDEKQKML